MDEIRLNGAFEDLSDEQLIVRFARSPDNRVARVLYERYAQELLIFAKRKVGTAEDAEDLVQELFAKCFDRADQFNQNKSPNPDKAFRCWLYGIGINCVHDYYRRHCAIVEPLPEDFDLPDESSPLPFVELVELKQLSEQISILTDGEIPQWLTPGEQRVWEKVWDNPRTPDSVLGRELGISGQRVGQVKKDIWTKIEASRSVIEQNHGQIGYTILKLLFSKRGGKT